VFCGFIAAVQGTQVFIVYCGVLVVVFTVQAFLEQRTRKQINLIIQIARELEAKVRNDSATEPEVGPAV
jgi:hypothetical protein